jgi:B12-binding domain/radical SAM domain protein
MSSPDIVLVHAPSVFDFRSMAVASGPVSDVVPSTSVFEMYPLGFLTLANHLAREGLSVRITNLALRMLLSRRFDPARHLAKMEPRAFGIDLHWLVHAHGALEVAKLLKRLHPTIPVIFGGLSASYYHEELIALPHVDFVLRGDSTERPLGELLKALRDGGDLASVANLTWKQNGEPRVNELSWAPTDLDGLCVDYGEVIRLAARNLDPFGHLPYLAWMREGSTALLPFRGCTRDCAICGGSCSAYGRFFGRRRLGMRSPEKLAEDIGDIAALLRGPIVILGDLRMGGAGYAERFFEAAARKRVRNAVMLELHAPADREFLERARRAFRRLNVQLSPESRDDVVRREFGRRYDNAASDEFLRDAAELCDRVDLFFMIGLPHQTPAAVDETAAYCAELLRAQACGGNVHPHIAPLAPFLDPGSRAFESPDEYGYRLFRRTLADHAEALAAPRWTEVLNYETTWMNRAQIAASMYRAAARLNRGKHECGLISGRDYRTLERNIATAMDSIERPDGAPLRDGQTVVKKELRWPTSIVHVRPLAALKALMGLLRSTG